MAMDSATKSRDTITRSVGFLIPEDDDTSKSHCVGLYTDEFVDDVANFDGEHSDLSYTITLPISNEFLKGSPIDSPIDISVRDLNSDILVSLADRTSEMRDLFTRNQEYFDTVRQSIFPSPDEQDWIKFLNLLYSSRYVISDEKWMSAISDYMEPNPTLLAKFKDIVGYCEVEEDTGSEFESTDRKDCGENDMTNALDNCPDTSYTGTTFDEPEIGFLDICAIRNYPKILENLETSYPQFFATAHRILSQETERRGSVLGGNHLSQTRRSSYSSSSSPPNNDSFISNNCCSNEDESLMTLYDEFKSTLVAPRQAIPDEDWEIAIYECLDPWPQLVAQFEEIIVYEISND